MKKHYFLIGLLFSSAVFATSMNEAFNQGRDVGKGNNGNAQQIMKDFQPNQIQGFQAHPQESQYYTGVKGGNPNLMAIGMNALENSESGKAIKDSIINNPKVKISQESDFIRSSNNIRNNAELISGIKGGQCVNQVLSKTLFSSHFCEKENNIEEICRSVPHIKWNKKMDVVDSEVMILPSDIKLEIKNFGWEGVFKRRWKYNKLLLKFSAPKNMIVKGFVLYVWNARCLNPNNTPVGGKWSFPLFLKNTLGISNGDEKLTLFGNTSGKYKSLGSCNFSDLGFENTVTYLTDIQKLKKGDLVVGEYISGNVLGPYVSEGVNAGLIHFGVKLLGQSEEEIYEPTLEWDSSCDIENKDTIKLNEICTKGAETKTVIYEGKNYQIHSDCWEKEGKYLVSEASDNECKKYENNPNCTVGERECILQENGTCTRHRVKYQCQTTTKTDGYICGDKFFCSDGSCSDLEGSVNGDFGHAVSQLATLAQAGKDVGLDPEHLKAFSGKSMFCRKSGFGFSDCCKDSGWGNKAGLAKCNSEEKTLGQAKEKKLVVYVGTYCSRKVLGKCIQRKSGYCVFDNKLARIIQYQGRSGQLGIGFGGAKNPDCRGITVDELQRIDFNAMDYSDFYDELNERTNLPDKKQLMEHMKNSIIDQLQEQQ